SGGFAPEDAVITKDVAETGDIVTSGGRVLSVVSLGADLDRARQTAYAAVDEIKWDGEHHRIDIAEAAAAGRIELADICGAPEAAVSTKDIAETGDIVTSGGRVLSVVSLGADLDRARQTAYAAVDEIKWDGEHHRTDIAEAAAAGRIELADI